MNSIQKGMEVGRTPVIAFAMMVAFYFSIAFTTGLGDPFSKVVQSQFHLSVFQSQFGNFAFFSPISSWAFLLHGLSDVWGIRRRHKQLSVVCLLEFAWFSQAETST